jgi:hypothetical protein
MGLAIACSAVSLTALSHPHGFKIMSSGFQINLPYEK